MCLVRASGFQGCQDIGPGRALCPPLGCCRWPARRCGFPPGVVVLVLLLHCVLCLYCVCGFSCAPRMWAWRHRLYVHLILYRCVLSHACVHHTGLGGGIPLALGVGVCWILFARCSARHKWRSISSSKGDPTLKLPGTAPWLKPWTHQRTIHMKLNRVARLHTASSSQHSGYSFEPMVTQAPRPAESPQPWSGVEIRTPQLEHKLSCSIVLQLGHLRRLPRVRGVSVCRRKSRPLFLCIDMKSLVAPQSTNNSTLESKELSRRVTRRPQNVNRLACSLRILSTLTLPSVKFFSSLLILMVEFNSSRGRPPPGL